MKTLASLLVTWIAVTSALSLPVATHDKNPPPKVTTHCGEVEGKWHEDVAVFKGIPYAKSPAGENRWRPSEMPEKGNGCWTGTFDATEFGNDCKQINGGSISGSEDCLFINVFTKKLSGTLLPVVLWIHGGGEMSGSGGQPGYSPSPVFAKRTGVVAVSLNYRLNVFGFLALNILNEGKGSGNYGFYDQILGLQWIQRNIEAFGGDKSRVTIIGQSGGGTCVMALMSSPLAKGLFHSAVLMSGSTTINATIDEADKDNQVFLTTTGCKTAACLRNTSADQLLNMIPFDVYPYWGGGDAWDLPTYGVIVGKILVVDGVLIPEPSLDVVAHGNANDVPLVIGSTGQESDISPPGNARYMNWDQYDAYVKSHMDTFQKHPANTEINIYEEVSQLYPHNFSSPLTGGTCVTGTPEYLLTSMASDIRVTCPIILLANYYAKYFKSPVYNYNVVQCPSPGAQEGGARYSYHTWGIDALFNFTFPPDPRWQPDVQDWGLVDAMQAWFSRFVQGQSPSPDWSTSQSGTCSLLYKPVMEARYHKAQCDFFNEHGFIPYRWQN